MKTYDTEQLFIRSISTEDKEFIFELYNSRSFLEFIGDRNIKTLNDAENYIQNRFLPQIEKLGFGNFMIIE